MATINWSAGDFCRDASNQIMDAREAASGAYTSSGTASNISGLSPKPNAVVEITASADAWVRFGGRTAAVGAGFFLPANLTKYYQVGPEVAGAVSVIDA